MKKSIVCIDAGHGGTDPGALGPEGPVRLMEKDVALEVALGIPRFLPAGEIEVVFTRKTDVFIPLSARCEIANKCGADVFLSIHCNSAPTPASGIETYIAHGSEKSLPLGAAIQRELTRAFPQRTDRGLKRAGFRVLTGTRMPAALAELEFIHTTAGEKHLMEPAVRIRYSQALAAGLIDFLKPVRGSAPDAMPVPGPTPDAFRTSFATVTERQIDALLDEAVVSEHQFWGKELLLSYRLRCGWSVTGRSACVDPANFQAELGRKYAREDAKRQLWMLEGYRLQWALAGV